MNFLTVTLTSLFIFSIYAGDGATFNPFDNFVGNYKSSSPALIKSINVKVCSRYSFDNWRSIKIEEKSSELGFGQSHVIKYNTVLNNSPLIGSHPIMDYKYDLGLFNPQDVLNYARNEGDNNFARNEIVTKTKNFSEKLVIDIEKTDEGLYLQMSEILIDNDGKHSCEYSMNFIEE